MARKNTRPASVRQEKMNSFLQQKISSFLLEEGFEGLTGIVTIKEVETTQDFREAKVWFSSINQDPEEVLKVLNKNIYEIQGELYRGATTRVTPRIRFLIDHSEEFSSHINEVIGHIDNE